MAGSIELRNDTKITSVAFKPDYFPVRVVGVGCSHLHEWGVESGMDAALSTTAADAEIKSMAVSADGRWVVTGDSGGAVTVWNAKTWEIFLQVKEHDDPIYAVDVSNDSTRFASGSQGGTVRIFDVKSGVRTTPPIEHPDSIFCVKFSPDGGHIATIVEELVGVYDVHSGVNLFVVDAPTVVTCVSSTPSLVWSSDGQKLFFSSEDTIDCVDIVALTDSDKQWSFENTDGDPVSIATSGTFIACCAGHSISFWDSASHKQIGRTIKQTSQIHCVSISRDRRYLACGHDRGVTVHALGDYLPQAYLQLPLFSRIPLMQVDDAVIKSWMLGDASATEAILSRSDEIMQCSDSSHHAFATRALIRAHLGQWRTAMEDAERSLQVKRSPIGHIAKSVALLNAGEQHTALDEFDFAFRDSDSGDNIFLLVIKSVLMFLCGNRKQAVSRLYGLITAADEDSKSIYHQVLGNMYLKLRDYENAVQTLSLPKHPSVSPDCGPLMAIFLISNWNFKDLEFIAWRCLCEKLHTIGSTMDVGETLLKMIGPLGEDKKEVAHGRILQEIVTRSGEATLLAWTGKSSTLNSCLPSSPAVYRQKQVIPPSIQGKELERRVAELRTIFPRDDALIIYGRVTRSQQVRFVQSRILLPCIVFCVKSLSKEGDTYHARTDGLGDVEFTTADLLPLKAPQDLVFVNMWIHERRLDPSSWKDRKQPSETQQTTNTAGNEADATMDDLVPVPIKEEVRSTPQHTGPDRYYTRALQVIAQLGHSFNALLLLRQPDGTYKRVAADRDIVVRGAGNNVSRDICAEVLEVV